MTGLTLAHEYNLNSMLPELHVQWVWVPMRDTAVSHPLQSQVRFRGAHLLKVNNKKQFMGADACPVPYGQGS